MGTGHQFICDTGLSIAVNQSKTGPPSTRFGFLCMHRVSGGIIQTVSTYLLAGLTMSAKREDQTAIFFRCEWVKLLNILNINYQKSYIHIKPCIKI